MFGRAASCVTSKERKYTANYAGAERSGEWQRQRPERERERTKEEEEVVEEREEEGGGRTMVWTSSEIYRCVDADDVD